MTNPNDTPTKECSQCRRILPATEEYFSPSIFGEFNLRSKCKDCVAGVSVEQPDGRVTYTRYILKYPEKIAARNTVKYAISLGVMKAASHYRCLLCGDRAQEWHHHRGYSIGHHLDVIPLCKKCHTHCDWVTIYRRKETDE